jgi:photosystem II stability/assembly factor-like uncharacterized protein
MKTIVLMLLLAGIFTGYKSQTSSWTSINTGFDLYSGQFIVKQNCIYHYNTNYSALIRSKNKGLTWDSLPVPSDSSQHLYSAITFVNDSVGFVAGYDGSVFSVNPVRSVIKKTTDRGQTWYPVTNGIVDSCLFSHINFFDANNGIVFGGGKGRTQRFKTQNGGASWSYVNDLFPYEIDLPSTLFSDFIGNEGAVGGFDNHFSVAITDDGGATWVTRKHSNSACPTALHFFDKNMGVLAVNDSAFFTINGALSFTAKRRFAHGKVIRDLAMIDMQRGFFTADTSIYYTPDGGLSWTLSFSDASLQFTSIHIYGAEVFVSSTGNKTVLKRNIASLISGASESTTQFGQLKIVPNPANEQVQIVLPDLQQAKVIITDQLGRVVKDLDIYLNGSISTADLAAGIYLVQVYGSNQAHNAKLVVAR